MRYIVHHTYSTRRRFAICGRACCVLPLKPDTLGVGGVVNIVVVAVVVVAVVVVTARGRSADVTETLSL